MRNDGECCRECKFYDGGECHRSPPQIEKRNGVLYGVWPEIGWNEWCGEFEKVPTGGWG